jgi:hypothetical protein
MRPAVAFSFTLFARTVFDTRVFRVFVIAHPPTDVTAASPVGMPPEKERLRHGGVRVRVRENKKGRAIGLPDPDR